MSNEQGERMSKPLGIGRTIAYALSIWPQDVVTRKTIAALVPAVAIERKGSRAANHLMRKRLREWEGSGVLERGREFVRIADRDGLAGVASADGVEVTAEKLDLRRALSIVGEQVEAEKRPHIRRIRQAELEFLVSLAEPTS